MTERLRYLEQENVLGGGLALAERGGDARSRLRDLALRMVARLRVGLAFVLVSPDHKVQEPVLSYHIHSPNAHPSLAFHKGCLSYNTLLTLFF